MYQERGCLARADNTMRTTQWQIILEELRTGVAPRPYDTAKPWDTVIKLSSFAQSAGARTHWWWLNLVGPLSAGGGAARALQTVDALENRPSSSWQGPAKGSGGKPGGGGGGKNLADQACYPWNNGNCKDPCPHGRAHRCLKCGGGRTQGQGLPAER